MPARLPALLALLAAPAAGAQPEPGPAPAVLLDGALRPTPVSLISLAARRSGREGEAVLATDEGQRARRPLREIAAIVPPAWIPAPLSTPGVYAAEPPRQPLPSILLTDGQQYPGRPATSGAGADLAWEHEAFGTLTLSLDHVSRIALDPAQAGPAPAEPPVSDTVRLANGDRIEGFIESVWPQTVVAPAAAPGQPPASNTTVEAAQVVSIDLSNPLERPTGMTAWLADGTVAALSDLTTDPATGRLTITSRLGESTGSVPGAGAASVDLSDLAAVVFQAQSLTPLASLPVADQRADPSRRHAPPLEILRSAGAEQPPLGAADILFPGPMTAEWILPAGSTRVAGWAHLPEEAWTWGDCAVVAAVVEPGGAPRELLRQRLSGASPLVVLNLELPAPGSAGRLRLSVEPGEHGPVQDRVVFRRMLVLTESR